MSIQPSVIGELKSKVEKRSYGKYLREMKLSARALKDQRIRFDFPVTALIGTNGGGKSTVLGAAALAYKSVKPSSFFPKSNVGDKSMSNWRVDFELIDKEINKNNILNRNARFVSLKWRRDDALDRDVLFFPISRTVPAGEMPRYRKFIGTQQATGAVEEDLSVEVTESAGGILGKDLSEFKIARLKKGDEDSIFLGVHKKKDYSQFHFGAGEASIIDIVLKLMQAKPSTLVLIEELENGLHPVAVEKLVEFLIGIAAQRKLQVIFTTHSRHALMNLPSEAIWACVDGNTYQGKLSFESLRAITGVVEKDKVVFVEDEFAKDWVTEVIRQRSPNLLHSVEIHAGGGYPHAWQVTKMHNKNPAIKSKAFCVLDGDVDEEENSGKSLFKLPGCVPEEEVYQFVLDNINDFASQLKQRCQLPGMTQDKIAEILAKVRIRTNDPHQLYEELGNDLGYVSEIIIRRAFISIYVEKNEKQMLSLLKKLDG